MNYIQGSEKERTCMRIGEELNQNVEGPKMPHSGEPSPMRNGSYGMYSLIDFCDRVLLCCPG